MSLPEPVRVDRPLASHFEANKLGIVVFGPGRGEAIVVIFPDATLGVVDGCREPSNPSGDPVRAFIEDWHREHPQIRGRIRFVALTHPHDDHYAGLARLITHYDESIDELWSTLPSGGHYANAYLEYMRIVNDNPDQLCEDEYQGLVRMHHVLTQNTRRVQIMQRGRYDVMMLKAKVAGRWARVRCIAPSHGDTLHAQRDLMRALSEASTKAERPRPRHDPNLTSGALVVSWGDARALLAGDLLLGHGDYRGWDGAKSSLSARVQVVKAAHHASAGAQDWALWQQMAPALAIVTPFKQAKRNWPPQPGELERLADQTRVALTSPPEWKAPAAPLRTRNSVLPITADKRVRGYDDAVGVCLDAKGTITKLVLAGRANFFG